MGDVLTMTPVQVCIDFISFTCHFLHVNLIKVMYVAKTRFMQRGGWFTDRVLDFGIPVLIDQALPETLFPEKSNLPLLTTVSTNEKSQKIVKWDLKH